MKKTSLLIILLLLPGIFFSQTLTSIEKYFNIEASAGDPLFTIYSAALSRTKFPDAMSYKADYYSDSCPVTYSANRSGTMFSYWKIDDVIIRNKGDYFKKPLVIFSFPDMMIMEYQPVKGIRVKETFFAYSYALTLVDIEVTNMDRDVHEVSVFPVIDFGADSLKIVGYNKETECIHAKRRVLYTEPEDILKTETRSSGMINEFFTASPKVSSYKYYLPKTKDYEDSLLPGMIHEEKIDTQSFQKSYAGTCVLRQVKLIRPHETFSFRYIRGTECRQQDSATMLREIVKLKSCFLKTFFEDNLMLFANVPKVRFDQPDDKLLYIGALNLARISMYPASGKYRFNFYFSAQGSLPDSERDQYIFDEAIGLMGYAYLDPRSAENSFRLLAELFQNRKPDTTLPLYNWIGNEIFHASGNKQFLKETYKTGTKLITNQTQVLSEFAGQSELDLMLATEERSLSSMAKELGKNAESVSWARKSYQVMTKEKMYGIKTDERFTWNYLVYEGLKNQGFQEMAAKISTVLKNSVSAQLSATHDFRSFYVTADGKTAVVKNYFPCSVIAKLLIDENVK